MNSAPSCPHEADVLDLATLGHWPNRAEPALLAHVAECSVCADLATVAMAVVDLRDQSFSGVQVPDASLVWYQAERRAREAAAHRAARPVLVVELAAVAIVLALGWFWAAGLAAVPGPTSWAARWFDLGWQGVSGLAPALRTSWNALTLPASASSTIRWTLLTLAAWAILLPIALSLASLADRNPHRENGPSGPVR